MFKFIMITFACLGWAFYVMSGGADFEPASARLTDIKVDPLKPSEQADAQSGDQEVTRVALNLTSVNDVLTDGGVRQADLPRQDATEVQVQDTPVQGDTVKILPSLATGATPEQIEEPETTSQASSFVQTTQQNVVVASFQNASDIRSVTANRVNVRGGPGTDFSVVGRLTRDMEIEVLEDTGSGWVRFQTLDGQTEGWVADFLLTSS